MGNRRALPGLLVDAAPAVAFYLLMASLVTGCDRQPAATRRQHQLVAIVGPSQTHPQWPGVRGGALRYEAAVPSVRIWCTAPPAATSADLLASVHYALDQQPQAVCLYIVDAEAARQSVDAILARQIVLVTIGLRPSDTRLYGHVDADLPAGAELLGGNLSSIAVGRKSYLLVHESGHDETATTCYERFMAAVQRHIGPELLASRNSAVVGTGLKPASQSVGTGSTPIPQSAARQIESLLATFPHAGLLVTLNPDVWLTGSAGWQRRLHDLNPEFRFATLAAPPALWRRLGTPQTPGDAAALVGPLDGDLGFAAVEIAAQALLSTGALIPVRCLPCELVTPENLPDFARRYAAAAGGLNVEGYLPATQASSQPPATRSATAP